MRTVPLRRLATLRYGDALAGDTRLVGEVPVFSSGGRTGRHDAANTTGPLIIVGRKGSHGSVWWSDESAFVIDTAYSIEASRVSCDLRWLYYVTQTLGLRDLSNDVGVPGLSREAAYSALVPAGIPIDEQRRIADFLDDHVARIDAIVAARRSQVDLMEEHRVSHLLTVLARAPQVPMRRVVTRFINGSTPGTGDADITDPRTIGWFTPSSIEATGLLGAPVRHVTRGDSGVVIFPPRSVLLVAIGASTAGRVTWLEAEGAGNQQLTALQADGDRIDPRLLWVQLEARRTELFRAAAATAQPLLSNETLKATSVFVPDRASQTELTRDALDQRDATTRARSGSLLLTARMAEFKQSLITAAVSGELDVTTANRTFNALPISGGHP